MTPTGYSSFGIKETRYAFARLDFGAMEHEDSAARLDEFCQDHVCTRCGACNSDSVQLIDRDPQNPSASLDYEDGNDEQGRQSTLRNSDGLREVGTNVLGIGNGNLESAKGELDELFAAITNTREEVRDEVSLGPSTGPEGPDVKRIVDMLNRTLTLNTACIVRHMRHFMTAERLHVRSAAQAFLEHTVCESEHSDLLLARISQLGGEPERDRGCKFKSNHRECASLDEFEEILRMDLIVEQIAIDAYSEMTRWLADVDPTSEILLDRILSVEIEHAEAMLDVVAT